MSAATRLLLIACILGLGALGGYAQNASESYMRRINQIGTTPTVSTAVQSALRSTRAPGLGSFQGISLPTAGVSTRLGSGVTTLPSVGSRSKPFSDLQRSPTVSPYLNLFGNQILQDDQGRFIAAPLTSDNYSNLVRPQLNQQSVNQQLRQQTRALNQRVQQIAAQPQTNPSGAQDIMATGHPTQFMYYSRFYPQLNRRRR